MALLLLQLGLAHLDLHCPALFAEHGKRHCWYVAPIARTLEVFTLGGTKWLIEATFKDADPVAAPPFRVHTFPLAVLWADAPPVADGAG